MNSALAREGRRTVSKLAFGHEHRLDLMLTIASAEDGICSLADLAAQLGVRASSLQRPLEALIELSLLSVLPSGETKYRHYIRNDGPAWHWAQELSEGLAIAPLD